jgi:uncharacterized protein (TIGR00369 family)
MQHSSDLVRETAEVASRSHPDCFVCSAGNLHGLHLRFSRHQDGGVSALFACDPAFQGYPGLLHGGIIAALLDGAMTHCLFAHGVECVTARLQVQYRRPIQAGLVARVQARISYESPPLYRVEAEVVQQDERRAEAQGTFLRADQLDTPPGLR